MGTVIALPANVAPLCSDCHTYRFNEEWSVTTGHRKPPNCCLWFHMPYFSNRIYLQAKLTKQE